MPGFLSAKVFLEKNPLGVINLTQPGARIFQRLAQNRMDRAGWRTQRVFNYKRVRMLFQQRFSFQSVPRDVGPGKRDFELMAELAREVPFSLDLHPLADRRKNRNLG